MKKIFRIIIVIILFGCFCLDVHAEYQLPEKVTVLVYDRGRTYQKKVISLENYIAGIIEGELGASFHSEAMQAQAIVSRTWLLINLKRHKRLSADFCSLAHCQVWRSPGRKAINAAKGTAEEILYPLPEKIFFTSSTARNADLDKKGKLYSAIAPNYNWKLTLSLKEIADVFDVSWRLQKSWTDNKYIHISAKNKKKKMTKEVFFERAVSALGNQIIRSPFFSVELKGPEVFFTGKGLGHGRGLPQWGAQARAQKGQDHQEILSAYFPKKTIYKIKVSDFIDDLAGVISSQSLNRPVYINNIHLPFEVEGYFITFKNKKGKTRGCSGALRRADVIAVEDLQKHIKRATETDPRYPAISAEELPELDCFFSLVTSRKDINSIYKYNVKEYGFVYEADGQRSVLLPGEARTARWALLELRRQAGYDRQQPEEALECIRTRFWSFPVAKPELVRERL